jgi:uncharacterized protein with von Willebrand factor type A (vWA) domain
MYPFAGLPENLAAFCAVLRRAHGFRVGPGELHDAARALEVVELSDERAVRHALRPILTSAREDAPVFDRVFTEFFFPVPRSPRESDELPLTHPDVESDTAAGAEPTARPASAEDDEGGALEAGDSDAAPLQATDDELDATAPFARSSYSPIEAHSTPDVPALERVSTEWRDAARSLLRRLHVGLSRRWKPASRGRRFDLRRTLRASLQTGGEALAPRWLRRPLTRPRFVLLIDGSRSMSAYAPTALQMAVAMASVTLRVEVFTFSTALRRVTTDVRRAAAGERRGLERLGTAWGGGTSIGGCLQQFLRSFGERLLSRDTVVIIASDGLDVGHTDTLGSAMRTLHRRAASVVWLNPLLETPGYEPTASGMRAARPYVSTFASVAGAADLARLARVVRVRA